MGKNILLLTGSPRKGGNSDLMADAFMEGAVESGNTVVKFETAFTDINGCTACNACYSNGNACVFDDDFNDLAPQLEEADIVVFCTPLYWYSFPAQLKAAIDKMYSFIVGNRQPKIKECYLLVCGEEGDEKGFDGIVKSYELILTYMKWTSKGILLVPGVIEKGDIKKTKALEKAKEMGRIV